MLRDGARAGYTGRALDPLSAPVRTAVGLVALAALTLAERARPLRRPTRPPNRRLTANPVVGAVDFVAGRGWGLLRGRRTPPAAAAPVSSMVPGFPLWLRDRRNHAVGL